MATVRNSIVASSGLTNAIACAAGTTVTYSVVSDAEFDADPTNVPLMAYGDLDLDADYEAGPASVAAGVAQWELGDPPTDINGAPRPAVAGSPDHAGADLPD